MLTAMLVLTMAKSELASPTPAPPVDRDAEPPARELRSKPKRSPKIRRSIAAGLYAGTEHHGHLRGEAYDDYELPDLILPPGSRRLGMDDDGHCERCCIDGVDGCYLCKTSKSGRKHEVKCTPPSKITKSGQKLLHNGHNDITDAYECGNIFTDCFHEASPCEVDVSRCLDDPYCRDGDRPFGDSFCPAAEPDPQPGISSLNLELVSSFNKIFEVQTDSSGSPGEPLLIMDGKFCPDSVMFSLTTGSTERRLLEETTCEIGPPECQSYHDVHTCLTTITDSPGGATPVECDDIFSLIAESTSVAGLQNQVTSLVNANFADEIDRIDNEIAPLAAELSVVDLSDLVSRVGSLEDAYFATNIALLQDQVTSLEAKHFYETYRLVLFKSCATSHCYLSMREVAFYDNENGLMDADHPGVISLEGTQSSTYDHAVIDPSAYKCLQGHFGETQGDAEAESANEKICATSKEANPSMTFTLVANPNTPPTLIRLFYRADHHEQSPGMAVIFGPNSYTKAFILEAPDPDSEPYAYSELLEL